MTESNSEQKVAPEVAAPAPAPPSLVVGVAASAGGLRAFRSLLHAIEGIDRMAFVLVQHLDPNHKSLLSELLSSHTPLRVVDAAGGQLIEPGAIYVIQPATTLTVVGGRLDVAPAPERALRLPADALFRSMAECYGDRAVGIVLSGAGSDGCAGLRAIRAAGGLTIAQRPDTAEQRGMPQAAIDGGLADLVLDIEAMPAALQRFGHLEDEAGKTAVGDANHPLEALGIIMRSHGLIELEHYKPSMVRRRFERRMTLSGFNDSQSYLSHVHQSDVERRLLKRDFLINVTEFFRDGSAFEQLNTEAITAIVSATSAEEPIRVWVAGCSTGEEVYSLAILLHEALDTLGRAKPSVRIFATDLDQAALAIARRAIYPASIASVVGVKRLERWFQLRAGLGFEVHQTLRDSVSFSIHDVCQDPPFSRMDLVSCRNLLIYLAPKARDHVLRMLQFAVEPGGFLFLGSAESLPASPRFASVSQAARIYRRVRVGRVGGQTVARPRPLSAFSRERATWATEHSPKRRSDSARTALLECVAPPSVVVGGDDVVLFTHGDLTAFLQFPAGSPDFQLHSVLRAPYGARVRALVQRCRDKSSPFDLDVTVKERSVRTHVAAYPAPRVGPDAVVVTLRDVPQSEGAAESEPLPEKEEALVEQLSRELTETRDDLRVTVEQLEASHEAMRASHEESLSMNEELQSANEELEASAEELRSVNEELTTVNSQLNEKIEAVRGAHDDLENFFSSTKLATLFLDDATRIKRFTPAAAELLQLAHSDVGQSIDTLVRELLHAGLAADCDEVLTSLTAVKRSVQLADGRAFVRTVLPYRTRSRRIDGVVVSFLDVTEAQLAARRLEQRALQQETVAKLGQLALRAGPLKSLMDELTYVVQRTLDVEFVKVLELDPREQTLLLKSGVGWKPGWIGVGRVPMDVGSQAGYTVRSDQPIRVENLAEETRFTTPEILSIHGIQAGMSCVIAETERPYGVLGAHCRMTRKFTKDDANFLQACANILSTAIARARTRDTISLERGVAKALLGMDSMEQAVEAAFPVFTEILGLTVGALWDPAATSAEGSPKHTLVVCDDPLARARWEATFTEHPASLPKLIALTRRTGDIQWADVPHAAADSDPPEHTLPPGLMTAVLIPVHSGDGADFVLTLFSPHVVLHNQAMRNALRGLSTTLSEFCRRARAEAAIRQSQTRLAIALKGASAMVYDIVVAGNMIQSLTNTHDLIGESPECPVPLDWWTQRVHPDDLGAFAEVAVGRGDAPVGSWLLSYRVRHADGRWIHVEDLGQVYGEPQTRRIGVVLDVTWRRLAETRLREADERKDRYIATLGHELRNPLAAIWNATELLSRSDDDATRDQLTAILRRQTHHIKRLVDGLLDISRIILDKVELTLEPVDLKALLERAIADREVVGDGGDMPVCFTDAAPGSLVVDGDEVRLVQVLDNLLTNAEKYGRAMGPVDVRLSRYGAEAVITVADNGPGFPADVLPFVFEPFRQAERAKEGATPEGLGIGLALVRGLAELHGGSVRAYNAPQGGACIEVRLPLRTHT